MSLISERPQGWNQVVGQDRVIRMLHALLRNPKYMTRGLIFEGPWAVGKTSCGYLFARGLMCQVGGLACGQCASCLTADESLDSHPSFKEVDAAQFPSVIQARGLLDQLYGQTTLGPRLVVIVDEAHNLSPEAFDVFLKPLERGDTDVIFIFVTSKGDQIPGTIRSRCAILRFGKVDQEALIGMLMSAADREGIRYRMDGLRMIARYAEGRPRDAMKGLSLTAALGEINPENVETALNFDAEVIAAEIYQAIIARNLADAITKADELAQRIGPVKVIETMFSSFARDVFTASSVAPSFAPLKEMSTFFVKWSSSTHLPADIMPLFVVELNEMRADLYRKAEQDQVRPTMKSLEQSKQVTKVNLQDRILSATELLALVEN